MGSNTQRRKRRQVIHEKFKTQKGVDKLKKMYGKDVDKLVREKL